MKSTRRAHYAFVAAIVLAACSLSACSTPPPPPAPVEAPPSAPPPPPAPPPVALSGAVVEAASAYEAYMAKAGAISPAFQSGFAVAQSLRAGESYEPHQLMRGAIAYGAVAALQDPAFVANMRLYAADPGTRSQVVAALVRDPAYVVAFKGSDSAAGLVVKALGDQAARMLATGTAVKQAAYDVQHQPWSLGTVPDRDQRLAEAKALSGTTLAPPAEGTMRLRMASIGAAPLALTGSPKAPPYTPMVIRSLAVAALAALGQAGEENAALVAPLLSERTTSYCLSLSKLNLYQCLAVAKPYYEDVFCLGQHALMDTGQCMVTASGAPASISLVPPPMALPAVKADADRALLEQAVFKNKS